MSAAPIVRVPLPTTRPSIVRVPQRRSVTPGTPGRSVPPSKPPSRSTSSAANPSTPPPVVVEIENSFVSQPAEPPQVVVPSLRPTPAVRTPGREHTLGRPPTPLRTATADSPLLTVTVDPVNAETTPTVLSLRQPSGSAGSAASLHVGSRNASVVEPVLDRPPTPLKSTGSPSISVEPSYSYRQSSSDIHYGAASEPQPSAPGVELIQSRSRLATPTEVSTGLQQAVTAADAFGAPATSRPGPSRDLDLHRSSLQASRQHIGLPPARHDAKKISDPPETSTLPIVYRTSTVTTNGQSKLRTLPDSPSSPTAAKRLSLAPAHQLLGTTLDVTSQTLMHKRVEHVPLDFATVSRMHEQQWSGAHMSDVPLASFSVSSDQHALPPSLRLVVKRQEISSDYTAPAPPPRMGHQRDDGVESVSLPPRDSHSTATVTSSASVHASLYVTCLVMVIPSEAHLDTDLDFDPVAEVRVTRCNILKLRVKRLIDLVHKALNFTPLRRGMLRVLLHENDPGFIVTPNGNDGEKPRNVVLLREEDALLSTYFDPKCLGRFMGPGEPMIRLRWIEDGGFRSASPSLRSSTVSTTHGPFVAPRSESHLTGVQPSSAEPHQAAPQHVQPTEQRKSQLSESVNQPVLSGFRLEPDPAPQTEFETTSLLPSRSESLRECDYGGAPQPSLYSQRVVDSHTPLSRSISVTQFETPAVSPVQPATIHPPNTEYGTTLSIIHDEPAQRPRKATYDDPNQASVRDTLPASSMVGHSPLRIVKAPATRAPASPAAVRTIVLDGVPYTPRSARAQQLAEEIAALRAALDAETR